MKTISFVIPVYNEAKRLSKTFKALEELRLPRGLRLEEVIFVNDGSTDRTELRIMNYESRLKKRYMLHVIRYTPNRGKGFALRTGILASISDYTLFFDADISAPLSELYKFMPEIRKDTDVIIGVRRNGVSTVIKHQPFIREMLGHVFTKTAKVFLGLKVSDITCGFKAFSRCARGLIFSQAVINGWGFDAEAILLAQKQDLSIAQVPIIWANNKGTHVKLHKAIPQTILELLLIQWEHNIKPAVKAPTIRVALSRIMSLF